jgi:hypothetical protein
MNTNAPLKGYKYCITKTHDCNVKDCKEQEVLFASTKIIYTLKY